MVKEKISYIEHFVITTYYKKAPGGVLLRVFTHKIKIGLFRIALVMGAYVQDEVW